MLRGYSEADRRAVARLASGSLGGSVEGWEEHYDPEKNPRLDPEQVYVVEEDGDIRAMTAILPLEVFVDGVLVTMGGVADVATHPAYRLRGYAGELMRAALGGMLERGVHLSMLHPFAHAFYRRYGWELATEAISYRLKPTDLPTSFEQKRVRVYRDEDLPRMMALLEGEASRHPLCVRRGEAYWRTLLEREGTEAAVYEADGRVEGYLLYGQGEGRNMSRALTVSELIAAAPTAWEALVSFMAAFDPMMFEVRYSTPRGEPLHPFLPSSYVEARVGPEFMLRLVNVEGALSLLQRASEAPFVLEVEDDEIPENAGPYTVGGYNGDVARGARAEERVTLDVRQLAQLYAGYLPARQLVRSGLVKPGSARAVELLEGFFPPGDPWLFPPDHF
ncbi:MAG: GNAT family N-acetyltransferase [Actinobacteria bacterium]|nr:GNAT family N-acetyltransferase [Actinomycetota bacterium]